MIWPPGRSITPTGGQKTLLVGRYRVASHAHTCTHIHTHTHTHIHTHTCNLYHAAVIWWRDVAKKDLQQIGIKDDGWYKAATAWRDGWRTRCREGVERHRQKQAAARAGVRSNGSREVKCLQCNRTFRREGDRKRHKCVDERGNHSANRKVLCNVCPAEDGLGVEEDWLSTDAAVPGSSC